MTMHRIRKEVSSLLAHTNQQLTQAEAKLEEGSRQDKVKAAGELVFLKRQKAALEARLNEIEMDPTAPESMLQWLKEEWFLLSLRFDSWLTHS